MKSVKVSITHHALKTYRIGVRVRPPDLFEFLLLL